MGIGKHMKNLLWGLCVVVCLPAFTLAGDLPKGPVKAATAGSAERHLANIRQLTFGRKNAEAYFSFDGNKLIFQSTNDWTKDAVASAGKPADAGLGCYQMYVMDLESNQVRLVSIGAGATTCGYFFPGDRRVLYSSTHGAGPNCPPKPKRDKTYR